MTLTTPFVAVDWGTTRMRAYLCTSVGDVLGRIDGPGIGQLSDTPSATLLDLLDDWVAQYGALDLILGGMVGSNIGWREAPYLACPMRPSDLAHELLEFNDSGHRVKIVHGVCCRNLLEQPDVMRGEEIQVLGWLAAQQGEESGLLCLPGTHTKWVHVQDGRIESFTTSITGELYALLRDHSVLIGSSEATKHEFDASVFKEGVDVAVRQQGHFSLLAFSTRSRAILESESFGDPSSYLSGLLVGADVRSALKIYDVPARQVQLIGCPDLCAKFALAMTRLGIESRTFSGDDMVLAGFMKIAELAE